MSNPNLPIKNKLEQREIQPSIDAWAKLESQLDEVMPQKKTPKFSWIGIAASMVILLSISIWVYLNSINSQQDLNQKEISNVQLENTEEESNNEHPNAAETVEIPEIVPKLNQPGIIEKTPTIVLSKSPKKEIYALENSRDFRLENEDTIPKDEIAQTLIEERVISIKQPNMKSSDELLISALKKRNFSDDKSIAINSKRLLNSVEDEIYEEKSPDLLEKLTDKLKSVQVAFAERNQPK